MATFFGEQEGVIQFVGSDTVVNDPIPPSMATQLATLYSGQAGRNVGELRADIAAGLLPRVRADLSNRENARQVAEQRSIVDQIIDSNLPAEEGVKALQEVMRGNIFEDHVNPAVALNLGSKVGQLEKRAIERALAAQQIVDKRLELQKGGFLPTLGYFTDIIISEPINNIVGAVDPTDTFLGGRDVVRLAREAGDLLFADISAEEFNTRFEDILTQVHDTGFFSEANPFAMEQFLNMVGEYGFGPESEMARSFQLLDLAVIAPQVIKGARGLSRVPQVLSKTAGNGAAEDAIVGAVSRLEDSSIVVQNTAPNYLSPAASEYLIAPELRANRLSEANNASLKAFDELDFGSYVDPKVAEAQTDKWLDLLVEQNANYADNVLDYTIVEGKMNNFRGVAILGKSDGTPFYTVDAAQQMATKVGGEVKPGGVYNGREVFAVHKEYNLPTAGLAKATNLDEVNSSFIHSVMSTTARTSVDNDARLKMAEAQIAKGIRDIGNLYTSTRKKLRTRPFDNEVGMMDEILRLYRDDPNYNKLAGAPSTQAFSDHWARMYGTPPRQEVLDHYESLVELNEVDYFLQADILFKDAVNKGQEMVKVGDTYYRGSKVQLEKGDLVYNPKTGKVEEYTKGTVHILAENQFRDANGMMIKHVLSDGQTKRRLYHSDVLEYNFGGHRVYTTRTPFFMKQSIDELTATGAKGSKETIDRTFGAYRLESEVEEATEAINTVIKAANDGADVPTLNRLVLSNNNWNANLENWDDFVKFFDDHDLDVSKLVSWAGDGERIDDASFIASPAPRDFYNKLNSAKGRGTKPLLGYGGVNLDTLNPLQSIERGFATSISRYGEQRYLFNAIEGWYKAAVETNALKNVDPSYAGNARAVLDLAIKDPAQYLRNTNAGAALRAEAKTIKFRLDNTTADIKALQNAGSRMSDAVYGWGAKGLATFIDRANVGNVPAFMRAIAFNMKLGLFAFDQFMVQASQALQIVSIVPKYGMQASATSWAMRAALHHPHPNNIKAMGEVVSKFTNMTADEFVNLVDWVKKTGRDVVDKTVVEENNSFTFYNNRLKRIADAGRVFFNEGERIARFTAAAANFMERKAANGAEDIFDEYVTRQMIRRQDVLTASMTAASAAPWQKSLLSVPLQFTTFQMRMLEQVAVAGVLTPAERLRLGIGQLIFYGAAGVPFAGWVADKFAYEKGIQADDELFNAVRYGAIDAVVLGFAETSLATRIAPGEGIWQMWGEVFSGEKSMMEFVGGPSSQVIGDSVGAFAGLGRALFSNKGYVGADIAKFARNFKSVDLTYNAWLAHKYGVYTSRRNGSVQVDNLSSVDALVVGLGIPLRDVNQAWTTIGFMQTDDKHLKRHTENIVELMRTADHLHEKEDWEGYTEVLRQVSQAMSILTPYERKQVLKALPYRANTLVESVFQRTIRRGELDAANRVGGDF